mmetsp:Transcript_36316/g.84851  ORF Transcript_36316/g.84851 Transcript_36316/m.84851 type:complete len:203 (-) Transcript_36316:132-740(-)
MPSFWINRLNIRASRGYVPSLAKRCPCSSQPQARPPSARRLFRAMRPLVVPGARANWRRGRSGDLRRPRPGQQRLDFASANSAEYSPYEHRGCNRPHEHRSPELPQLHLQSWRGTLAKARVSNDSQDHDGTCPAGTSGSSPPVCPAERLLRMRMRLLAFFFANLGAVMTSRPPPQCPREASHVPTCSWRPWSTCRAQNQSTA